MDPAVTALVNLALRKEQLRDVCELQVPLKIHHSDDPTVLKQSTFLLACDNISI